MVTASMAVNVGLLLVPHFKSWCAMHNLEVTSCGGILTKSYVVKGKGSDVMALSEWMDRVNEA